MNKDNLQKLIGNTPLVRLENIEKRYGVQAKLYAKVEGVNAGGSIKDRVALAIVEDAEKTGKLRAGGTIIEPTSGNTGVGLALVAAVKGYKAVIVMPDTMSVERQILIKAYGAEVVLTDGAKGMQGAVDKAEEAKERKALQEKHNQRFPGRKAPTEKKENKKEGKVPFFKRAQGVRKWSIWNLREKR